MLLDTASVSPHVSHSAQWRVARSEVDGSPPAGDAMPEPPHPQPPSPLCRERERSLGLRSEVGPSKDGPLLLAIDQGTSSTKVILFDLDGRVVASAGGETPVYYPRPTWMESDAEAWWRTITASIRRVLATPGVRPARVRAVGVCGFMHTLVPVDQAGRALHAPILWPDQRASAEAEELAAHSDLFARAVGRPPTTMMAAPRLRWLARHHPEALARAHTFLLSKDIIRHRLTGVFATDRHDAAGTGLLDRSTGNWSAEVLALVGVSPERMPPILRPDQIAGAVNPDAAAETGLSAGTPVVCGTGDWFCTVIGSGCYLPERICFYLGTAGILGAFESEVELDRLGQTRYFGSVTATGSALRWARDLFRPGDDSGDDDDSCFERLCDEAACSEPGARGLLFLPHLMGERGGGMRPHARGSLYGLTLAHRRPDIVRAVLEGAAFWLRTTTALYFGGEPVGDFLAMGGGARSRLWRRVFAAVFNRALLVPEVVDGGALGAAMLAAVGSGLASSYAELGRRWTRIVEVEQPDPTLVDRYARIYEDFGRLEAALSCLFAQRNSGLGVDGGSR